MKPSRPWIRVARTLALALLVVLAFGPRSAGAADVIKFVVSTPQEYFDLVKGSAEFPEWEGDLNPVFQGCYSARIAVKLVPRNRKCLLGLRLRYGCFRHVYSPARRPGARF